MGKDGAERVEEVMVVEEGSVGKRKRLLEEDETYVVDNHGIGEAEKANQGDNASMSSSAPLFLAPLFFLRGIFKPPRKASMQCTPNIS